MSKCMVCGAECREIECSGKIKNMEIVFCDAHAAYCENCESVKCNLSEN